MSERELIECEECNWSYGGTDRVRTLKAGFYHVIGRGHDVTRQDEIEDEFDL